jgi:hypothetical protein
MTSLDFKEDTDHDLKAIRISVSSRPCLPQTSPLLPQPHPSFPALGWKPEEAVVAVTERYNNEAWVFRTYFGGFGEMHCIATAPPEVFLLFLNQLRYPYINAYKESLVPWKSRYPLIGKLLSEGYVHLMRIGQESSDDAAYYLVPRTTRPLTCTDLFHEKRWDHSLCCKECHKDVRELTQIADVDAVQSFTSDGGPEGRKALVCCRAYLLLQKDYYWGKKYHPYELPEHDY